VQHHDHTLAAVSEGQPAAAFHGALSGVIGAILPNGLFTKSRLLPNINDLQHGTRRELNR
jgi:hypothetical protein